MRANPEATYSQQRSAYTKHLRKRAQRAESEAAALRAELAALRSDIRRERREAAAFVESPEWERDLLCLAQERIRAEMMQLSLTRKSCEACGSFGREFQRRFLDEEIDTLTQENGLPPPSQAQGRDMSWPLRLGAKVHKGRLLKADWMTPEPKPPQQPRRAFDW